MKSNKSDKTNTNFAIPKKNVLLIIVGFLVLILGYALLAGGGSSDPQQFSPEIFSVRRLYVAPIVMILGVIVVIVGIMKKK